MYIIVRVMLWILAAWRWGDWRNWKNYQSTFLFFIMLDLLYIFLTYNYPLWAYAHNDIIPNHTFNNLLVTFISYPSMERCLQMWQSVQEVRKMELMESKLVQRQPYSFFGALGAQK